MRAKELRWGEPPTSTYKNDASEVSSKTKEIELEGGKRTKARQSFLLDSSTNPLAMASCEPLEQWLGREACSLKIAKKAVFKLTRAT